MTNWLILIAGITANASASVLIKLATLPPRRMPTLQEPLLIISNWPLWLGILLYGIAFVLYALALTRFPLHIAHPILTAGAIASVALVSFLFFKEPFYWTTGLGILFIIFGVWLVTARPA